MNPLVPNPQTGFLESRNHSLAGFTSDKKQKFIELATAQAQMGAMPSIPNLCKTVDISNRTFYTHLKGDPSFKEAWDATLDMIEDTLVSTMVGNAQRPSGYMDRITWLRAYRPGRWNPDARLQTPQDISATNNVISVYSDAIDGELVANPPKPAELPPINTESIPGTESNSSNASKSVDNQVDTSKQ